MAFTGTLDKCKACDKTVYFVDLLSADGATYHKSCFKCSHCKGTLVMSNYSSMEGVLYCKTHFEQLFKESGNFSKNFHSSSSRENSLTKASNKYSSMFSGTQDKCPACSKTVYPLEKVTMEGESYHKSCFKCSHGGCALTHATYAALDGVLYCKHHFTQLFMEKGNYQHVLKAGQRKNQAAAAADSDAEAESDREGEEAPPAPQPQPEPEHKEEEKEKAAEEEE